MSRDQLAEHVWGGDYDPFSNVADVYIGYLRRKLHAAGIPSTLIQTMRGHGLHAEGGGRVTTSRRAWSFRTRLTLRWTVAFGLLLALTNVAIYVGSRFYAYNDFDVQLRTVAAVELASAVDENRSLHLHDFTTAALGDDPYARKFSQTYAADGRATRQVPSELGPPAAILPPEVIAATLAGETPIVNVTVQGRPARMLALRVTDVDAPAGLAVGLYTDTIDAWLGRLMWLLSVVWGVGLAATAAVGSVLAARALVPIDRITARAGSITHGNIDARLDPAGVDDEIGRMTNLLNEMLDRLHAAIEANRRFAADASHELRSPLTAIAGEVDVTLKRDRTPAEYRETLRTVRERLDDMTVLTEDLMLLGRAEGRPGRQLVREVPVGPIVEPSIRRWAPTARKRQITVRQESLEGLVAYCEPGLLARVVDNLLSNAIQYNRDGGSVTITGAYAEPGGGEWEAGFVRIQVEDTGPGIPEDEWERVFERFYRREQSRSRRTGGAGLGLPLCRAITSLFGGAVRIIRSSPAGTTFEIRLPGCLSSATSQ